MADIDEDFLNEEIDYELDTELDEEALLGDGDDELEEETERRNSLEQLETKVDLQLEAEDLYNENTEELNKINTSEIEEEYKGGRKEKFMSERKLITPPENNFDNPQNKKTFSYQRNNNNIRGTTRGRGRGYANVIRRNKTVLINPNFQGIVHVNSTNARLHNTPTWASRPLQSQPPMHVQPGNQQPQMNMQMAQRQPPVMQMHLNAAGPYQSMVPPQVYQQPPQNFGCPPQQHNQPAQFQYQGHPPQQPFNMSMDRQVFANPPPNLSMQQPMFNTAQPPPHMSFESPVQNFQPNQQFQNPNIQYQNNNMNMNRNNSFQNQHGGGYMNNNNLNNNNNYQNQQQAMPQQPFVKRRFVKPQPFDQRKKFKFVNNNTGRNNLPQNRLVRENRLGFNVEMNGDKPSERPSVITQVKVEDPNEDDETKKLRLQIELQKKRREEILRWKEERRKQVLQKTQQETNVNTTAVVTQVVPTSRPAETVVRIAPQNKNLTQIFTVSTPNKQAVRPFLQNRQNLQQQLQPKQRSPNIVVTNGYSRKLSKYQRGVTKVVNVVSDNNRVVTATVVKNNPKDHLASFLSDRKVLVKDESLINTRAVMIKNLSTSTTDKRLISLGKSIGEVQKLQRNKPKQQATIVFKSVASAHAFYKKYQRHMIDLSMIEVTLVPKLEPAECT